MFIRALYGLISLKYSSIYEELIKREPIIKKVFYVQSLHSNLCSGSKIHKTYFFQTLSSIFARDSWQKQLNKEPTKLIQYSNQALWYRCLGIRDLVPKNARNINRLHGVNKCILNSRFKNIFSLPKRPKELQGPNRFLLIGYRFSLLRMKRSGLEFDHSSPLNAGVNYEQNLPQFPLQVFMVSMGEALSFSNIDMSPVRLAVNINYFPTHHLSTADLVE